MRALSTNKPLLVALLGGAAISIIAFAAFHRSLGARAIDGPPVSFPVAARLTEAAKTMGREVVADTAPAVMAFTPLAAGQAAQLHLLPPPPKGSRGPTQLIRTANVSLQVKDVERALRDASLIADEQLGDVIGLNDTTPGSDSEAHYATIAIRVPQYRFDRTLDALGRLGKVTSQSANAQDVSDQLVDAQARLRNLRRTEADMLAIMDRSGNIDQVLNVTQQISSVREQIERLDAQIQSMQYQVAYSTINVSLTSPVAVNAPTGLGVLAQTWKNALASLGGVTIGLMSLMLWIAAFSPYLVIVGLLAVFVLHKMRAHAAPSS